MTSTYEIAFYKAGNRIGGYKVPTAHTAGDEFAGCVERYTAVAGFYIDVFDTDCCAVVDLSEVAMTIKLIGAIDADMKKSLMKRLDELLKERQ